MADFELPPFQSTLKQPPAAPNLSFNPGANPDTGIAQVQLEKQQQQNQMNQQGLDNALRTVQMASHLAQSFVEASKARQQRDAVQAYAASLHDKELARVMTTTAPEAAQRIVQQAIPVQQPLTPDALIALGIRTGNQDMVSKAVAAKRQSARPNADRQYIKQMPDGPHNFVYDQTSGQEQDLGLAAAKPAAPKALGSLPTKNILGPDGKTHIMQIQPDGTQKDLGLAGSATTNSPTSTERNMGGSASAVLDELPHLRQLIQQADAMGLIGPGKGRLYQQFMLGKIGSTGDPVKDALLGQLKTTNSLVNSATLKAHFGARGGQQMYEKFVDNLNSGQMSSAALNGSIDSVERFMRKYAQEGGVTVPQMSAEELRASVRKKLGL